MTNTSPPQSLSRRIYEGISLYPKEVESASQKTNNLVKQIAEELTQYI
jgi:hypothetical protein